MHPVSRHRASWQEPSGHYVKSVRWQYGGAPVGKLQPYVIRVQVGGCTCLINIIVKKIIVVSDVRSFHNILILDLDLYGIALHDCIPSQQHACIVLGIGSRHQRHALVRMHGHVHVQRLTDCCIPDKGTNITRRCKWHPKETTLDTMRNLWMCPAPPPPLQKTHPHTHPRPCMLASERVWRSVCARESERGRATQLRVVRRTSGEGGAHNYRVMWAGK